MSTYPHHDRGYTIAHSMAQDLCFESSDPYVFDLSHLSCIDVIGENDRTFLQGQLTCDVNAVTSTQMQPGGMCSLQGRLLALLDVIAWQGMHLILPHDILAVSQKSLAKTALFSRVSLKSNDQIKALGLYIPEGACFKDLPIPLPQAAWQATQNEDLYCYALSPQLLIILFRQTQQRESLFEHFKATHQRGSLAWHYLTLQLPRLNIYTNTREIFLPHRLDLQTTPYLSFNKGCYKGQEIIARTQYRAKLKHHLALFQIQSSSPIFAGQKCFNAAQTEIGEIVDYCPLDSEHYLIAMSILFEHPNTLFLEHQTASVALQPHRSSDGIPS